MRYRTTRCGSRGCCSSVPDSAVPGRRRARHHRHRVRAQVKDMFRVAACGSDAAIPKRFAARDDRCALQAHGVDLRPVPQARGSTRPSRSSRKLRPSDAPTVGRLSVRRRRSVSSALTVFPDATEVTTLSLEAPGDIRAIDSIDKAAARRRPRGDQQGHPAALSARRTRRRRAAWRHRTPSCRARSCSRSPASPCTTWSPSSFATSTSRPTARSLPDEQGARRPRRERSPRKGTQEEALDALLVRADESRSRTSRSSSARAATTTAPLRTYRHILANLDDAHNKADARVIAHLESKGKVAVMTKAASFLLWWDDFSTVRDYLLAHAAWMISDASGHSAALRRPGRLRGDHVRRLHRAVLHPGPDRRAQGVREAVGRPAAPRSAVPVRLSRQGQAEPPDGDAAEVRRTGACRCARDVVITPHGRCVILDVDPDSKELESGSTLKNHAAAMRREDDVPRAAARACPADFGRVTIRWFFLSWSG